MRINRIAILLLSTTMYCGVHAAQYPSFQHGRELYESGRWVEARAALLKAKDDVTVVNHDDLEAIDYYLALCAVGLNDPQAEDFLVNFKNSYPKSIYSNDIAFAKAMLYSSQELYDQAKTSFEVVEYDLLTSKQKEDYNIRSGYIAFLSGDYSLAEQKFEQIPTSSEYYDHALYYRSYIYYNDGNFKSSRTGFESLLASDTYKVVAPYYLMQIDFAEGRYSTVLKSGKDLLASSIPSRQAELARVMAESAFKLEDYSKAVELINLYQEKGGEMFRSENYILGFSLYRLTQYSDAIPYLRNACGADDELTQNASYHLADCYLRRDNKDAAMQSFAMAANDKFDTYIAEDALFNYAKLQYEQEGDLFNGTINTLTRYINEYPNTVRAPKAKELLIAAYYNSRNYDAAYKAIKEVNNPDSEIRTALQKIALYRGLEAFNSGDYKSAERYIDESLSINISPKYSSLAKFWMGEIDFANGNYELALSNYNSYIIRAPKSDDTYNLALYNIGYCNLMLENNDSAIGYFKRYIDSEKDLNFYTADAANRIGDINYGKRQFNTALEFYNEAIDSDLDPKYYAQYQYAMIKGITNDNSSKYRTLKSIIANNKGEYVDDAMYELGRSYVSSGDYANGVKALEQFIVAYPQSNHYSQSLSDLGLAYLNLGEKDKSISYYDKAIKSNPRSAVAKDALQGVREIYINSGEADRYFDYATEVGMEGDLNKMTRDSLSFTSAQRSYLSGSSNISVATNDLENYVKNYPEGYYTTDALFYLSDCYLKANKKSDAIETLTDLSKRGKNQYSEKVLDRLSKLTFAEKMYDDAAKAYYNLYEISQSEAGKTKALNGYIDATIATNNTNEVLRMTDNVLRLPSVNKELQQRAKYVKATTLEDLGNTDQAMLLYTELSEDPMSKEGAEAAYKVIKAAYKSDIDIAEEMIFEFSESNTPQAYWLAKSFLILGDIYVARKDNFQARATYQSIVDGYSDKEDGVIDEAKNKISKLAL